MSAKQHEHHRRKDQGGRQSANYEQDKIGAYFHES